MQWLWTWGGKCFGYREDDELLTHDGRHVGRFEDDEVYGKDGRYLGEVINGRLITHKSKKSRRRAIFTPYAKRAGYAKHADYAGYAMYAGYEDFPAPKDL